MEGYLGETIIDIKESKFANFTQSDFVMLWIEHYGSIDGAHHKDWVLDQVSRILKGTKVIISLAKWKNGHEEYRFELDEPTIEYYKWVEEMKYGEDGPDTYEYEYGIAP